MHSATFAIMSSYALLTSAQIGQNTASGTESLTPFQSTQATCLDQCHTADVGCQTTCINVHNPSVDPILATQKCQAACVQGDGSVEQTSAYGVCLQNCIDLNKSVSTVGEGAPSATGSAAASSTSGSATAAATSTTSSAFGPATTIGTSNVSGTSAGSSRSATASGAVASVTATGNAADAVRVGLAGLGLIGLLAAFVM